jgi:hypothetical protein
VESRTSRQRIDLSRGVADDQEMIAKTSRHSANAHGRKLRGERTRERVSLKLHHVRRVAK